MPGETDLALAHMPACPFGEETFPQSIEEDSAERRRHSHHYTHSLAEPAGDNSAGPNSIRSRRSRPTIGPTAVKASTGGGARGTKCPPSTTPGVGFTHTSGEGRVDGRRIFR